MTDQRLFRNRIRSRAELKARLPLTSLSAVDAARILLQKDKGTKDGMIYIHVPFCDHICKFCGYNRIISDKLTQEKYVNKIIAQIENLGEKEWTQSKKFSVIHFGGGSPSCLDNTLLFKIINAVKKHLPLNENPECTLECTLSHAKIEKLSELLQHGFNRISLGVQSFDGHLRHQLGRLLNRNQVIENIQKVHDAGFSNICIDLIYNQKDQTIESWQKDLELLKQLPITGCSVYPLINFPNSGMAKSNEYQEPDPELEYKFYTMVDDFLLSRSDWACFTPVQYGNTKSGQSNYIKKNAQGIDILALGSGAGGRIGNTQYLMERNIKSFLGNEKNDIFENAMTFQLDQRFSGFNHILSLAENMHLKHVVLENAPHEIKEAVRQLEENHLIESGQHRLELTQLGRFWAGNIADFLTITVLNSIK